MRKQQVYTTVKRWTVTIEKVDRERVLFFGAHGIYTWPTQAEAEAIAKEFRDNPETQRKLAEIYKHAGAAESLQATEVECWAGHFDPVRAVGF